MSKSARKIVEDFDVSVYNVSMIEDAEAYKKVLWDILNDAIDCLREHVELGILT